MLASSHDSGERMVVHSLSGKLNFQISKSLNVCQVLMTEVSDTIIITFLIYHEYFYEHVDLKSVWKVNMHPGSLWSWIYMSLTD